MIYVNRAYKSFDGFSFKDFFVICRALNPTTLLKEKQEYLKLNIQEKLVKILKEAGKSIIQNILILSVIKFAANRLFSSHRGRLPVMSFDEVDSLHLFVIGPLHEEILFRGIIQNIVMIAQKLATQRASENLKKQRVFRILTSPSTLIIFTNTLFAAIHLANRGRILSTKGTIIQCTNIVLRPTYSLLHYTTGSILAPVIVHSLNNFVTTIAGIRYE